MDHPVEVVLHRKLPVNMAMGLLLPLQILSSQNNMEMLERGKTGGFFFIIPSLSKCLTSFHILYTSSNPYTNASRPGTAAAAVGATPQRAPVSGTLDPNSMPALSQEYKYLQDGLLAIVEQLTASATGSMEKKQAAESTKAVAIFIKTLARGGVDEDVANKVGSVLSSLQNRDYSSASSIVTGLVSNEWKDHKDWLKGLKFLVQMAAKKQI